MKKNYTIFAACFLLLLNTVNSATVAASIGNFVWEDMNGNGLQDAGEPGIANVPVALLADLDSDGAIDDTLAQRTTDATGLYLFDGLAAGTYALRFGQPTGYFFSAHDLGGNDATDSDADAITGLTGNIVLTEGENNLTYDAGYFRPASIGNFTWEDTNANGIQDTGEPGLPGVQVTLIGTTGTGIPVASTTTTDLSGQYLFGNLTPGTYKLTFAVPFGGKFTAADRGTNDAKDSDANPATGQTLAEVLSSGENNENYDAGYIELQYFIEGKIVYDKDWDCVADTAELGLGGVIVKATFDNEQYHARSQTDGRYKLYAPNNRAYQLSVEVPKPIGGAACNLPPVFLALNASKDIPLQNVVLCAALSVDIGTAFLRRCAQATYQVKYCNEGAIAAENAYIDIHLDSFLNFQSAGRTYIALGNNWFRFPIGKIMPFDCGNFFLKVEVNCAATLGQTHCTEAHIYPDGVCYFDNAQWSGAKLEARARCTGDSLHFILKNAGNGPMTTPLEFVIIEDGVMSAPVKTDPLDPNDSLVVKLPGNGSTWRVQARQEPTYRGWSQPVLSVEGCTQNSAFSLGFVNQFAQNENAPALDLDCTANVGSYDPNDKGGIPLGLSSNRYIEPLTELEYMIRFQNTGTDTAFQVVLRDTLSTWFDLTSFRPGASSHPYSVELRGNGVLVFDFPDIVLPHKAINEPGSQGFVRYSITPKATTPLQTRLFNRAGIYFDQNAPVITNRTLHRLGVNFVPVSVWQPKPALYDMRLSPNPMGDWVTVSIEGDVPAGEYHLKVFSATGQLLGEQQAPTPLFRVFTENFPQGPLFFHVLGTHGEIIGISMGTK